MHMAYEKGADRIWILNVGDLKPLEIPINHFLDLAYDMPRWSSPTSTQEWLMLWATREFGADVAPDVSAAVDQYGKLAARRKYELLDPTIYSVINYNEVDAVLAEWSSLAVKAQAIYDTLDSAAQPAFYEMVLQPVLGGMAVYQIHLGAARNYHYVEQKRTSTNAVAQDVLTAFAQDANLTKTYHSLLGGKWNHILDQTHLGYDFWCVV